MALFSESGLTASGYRDMLRLCDRCGARLDYIPDKGFCCPNGHGCEWPREQREPPEPVKARCYQKGDVVYTSQSKGRKRKKNRKEKWISDYIET